jgi:hypothetical protein
MPFLIGDANVNGIADAASRDVMVLGSIIFVVITFGLTGHIPVFSNDLRMFSLVKAQR